ncbi:protocadherin beta-2-like [Saccostrea cucullata]|uniref:protocadherin beta-2-like n=1 Tax=Saccostrea cuccullata TaxID=36930 RepID=UPI002ED176F3
MTCVPTGCPFNIHNSGEILATSDLSQHTVPGYDLYVYVSDGKTLVGPRTLTVIITGINSVPVITNLPLAAPITVPENSALSMSVFQVSVSDVNTADNHTYAASYNHSLGSTLFSLNSATGLVSTSSTQNINFESVSTTATTYVIIITATDGQATATGTLSVVITDQNEAPVFGKASYAIFGNEGSARSTVGDPSFDVTDPDTGETLSYSIDCSMFLINASTGVISFSHDYDLDRAGTASTVTCTVTVTDGDLSDTASLVVTINDVNDNTPTFGSSTYTFYTQPNTGVGTVLGSIAATDGDVGSFGTTSVTIVTSESTTATPSSTTDRHVTFLEDSRNVAWLTVAIVLLTGLVLFCGYLFARFGSFPCKNGSYKPNATYVTLRFMNTSLRP